MKAVVSVRPKLVAAASHSAALSMKAQPAGHAPVLILSTAAVDKRRWSPWPAARSSPALLPIRRSALAAEFGAKGPSEGNKPFLANECASSWAEETPSTQAKRRSRIVLRVRAATKAAVAKAAASLGRDQPALTELSAVLEHPLSPVSAPTSYGAAGVSITRRESTREENGLGR